jgi:glycosyltransferase involved in cell wall biosynthesis
MKVLIFIPVYNCEKQILRVIEKLSVLPFTNEFEFLFVDNMSSDNSAQIIEESIFNYNLKNAHILQNEINYGFGGSHKIAITFAVKNDFDILVTLHGDDQADPTEIVPATSYLDSRNLDCYLGSRFKRKSRLFGYSRIRILGNLILNGLFSLKYRRIVSDMGSGLNVYKTIMFKKINLQMLPLDLTFNNALLAQTLDNGLKVEFFPISWHEKDQISNARMFKQAFQIVFLLIMPRSYRSRVDPDLVDVDFRFSYTKSENKGL